MPLRYRPVFQCLVDAGAAEVTWLVALGTYRPLSNELSEHLGAEIDADWRTPSGKSIHNHAWREAGDPSELGEIAAS
jgi:hypothetical protein